MAVVTAFGTLAQTTHAGLTAYFRATGCTALTIADVLPLLSKIIVYEQEYIIGEMKIWDTGTEAIEPNNCAMCKIMVYNDGWIVAWFEKESQNQEASGACTFIDAQTLGNVGSVTTEYSDKYNGCRLKVISSSPTDPECPDDTVFCIRDVDSNLNQVQVHAIYEESYHILGAHFNTGHTYAIEVYQDNGNLVWWGHNSDTYAPLPPNLSNRLYRAIYEMWENLKYSSNATNTTDTVITKAFLDDGGSFTDYTTAFNNSSINDVPLIPSIEVADDAFYFGSENKFNGLKLDIDTAAVGNTIVWEYWDGSNWSSIVVTDNTVGFTVLTIHNHKIDDTTNTITSTDATDQGTVNTLLNEIKSDYNTHRVSTTFHDAADNTNVVSSADASNLATSMTLANEIKIDYNAHRSQSGIHPYDDSENSVTAADAVDLTTCITLTNEIKGDYNAHLIATQDANTVIFTPPENWIKCFVNSSEQFWIRSRVSVAAFTTQPLLTQGWVIVQNSLLYTNSNLGMYSFEDTGANYCLLCGINEYTAYTNEDDVHFYNTSLPGKTIYKHSISLGGKVLGSAGYVNFYVNDKTLLMMYMTYMEKTNGYIIFNIKTIAGTTAIQNAFNCHGESIANYRYTYGNMASVLIVS